jgi:hypothetical protein
MGRRVVLRSGKPARSSRTGVSAFAVLTCVYAGAAAAAPRTWTGADPASPLWSDPDNWSGGSAPAAGDDVTFGAASGEDAVLDVDVAIASLTISGYTGRLAPAGAPRTMTIAGNLVQTTGTFTAPAFLVVGGRFDKQGGTFDAGSGAVFLTSAAAQDHRLASLTFANLNVSDGLVAYWQMDDVAPGARDVSGGGTHLIPNGGLGISTAAPTTFPNPRSLAFTGMENGLASEGASYPSVLKPAAWTVSLWFRPAATFFESSAGSCGESGADGPGAELISAGEDYALRICRTNSDGTNHVRLFFRTTAGKRDCIASNAFVANGTTWHHLAGTASGATRTVFLDGVATSCSFPEAQAYQQGALKIARHFTQGDYDFTGAIDDVRIYNRALAAGEVQALQQGRHPAAPATRHVLTDPLVVAGDLVIASRVLEVRGSPPAVGGTTRIFGGGLVLTVPPDAGPPEARDAAPPPPDAPPPKDAPADAPSVDQTPPFPDTPPAADSAPAPESDGGTSLDAALSDDAAGGTRRVELDVGCACAIGAVRDGGAALLLALVPLLALTARRRR